MADQLLKGLINWAIKFDDKHVIWTQIKIEIYGV
jgi:hypothetical protein